ncbi:PfkB family carbohydrate kinase, partial [Pseudorhodobacter sp.]|uniref:PfkB family carbohydrate kinase n=1 Tax=Pseudorhodobacter sp. TaxID=1934400 RepID=UPI0026493D77
HRWRECAHVLTDGQHWHLPAVPTQIVDATGAGDLFAGAFLWGMTNGYDLQAAARMGNIAASEVISHIGARPEADLKALFVHAGVV